MSNENTFIFSNNQSGGITAHTVNIANPTRNITNELENQMRETFALDTRINIFSVLGDAEAFSFATKILNWLKDNGYNNVNGVSRAIFNDPITGQKLSKIKDNEYTVTIGSNI